MKQELKDLEKDLLRLLAEEADFDPNLPQETIQDIRRRLQGSYVIFQPQIRILLESHDALLASHRRLFSLLESKLGVVREDIRKFIKHQEKKNGKFKEKPLAK